MKDRQHGRNVEIPSAPLRYQVLTWARDMKISYVEALNLPMNILSGYLEMRELEDEYGPNSQNYETIEE